MTFEAAQQRKRENLDAAAQRIDNPLLRRRFVDAVEAAQGDREKFDVEARELVRWRWLPVRIDVFVEQPLYLNLKGEVWPKVMEDLEEAAHGGYAEVILTGAIGAAKTYTADLLAAYQMYCLTCLAEPQREYGLSVHTNVSFVLQSVTLKAAEKVLYSFLSRVVRRSPYFQQLCPFEKGVQSELRFDRNMLIEPVASTDTAAIGENVCGAILDETNFRPVVTGSARMPWLETYDAAVQSWNALSGRIRSRFLQQGVLPGAIIGVSSSRYPEDFTERKMAEAAKERREKGKSMIFVAAHSQWEVKPPGTYNAGTFRVVVGKGLERSRILADEDVVPVDLEVLSPPTDLRPDFERDIERAVREIGGRPTRAINPFITRREMIAKVCTRVRHAFTLEQSTLRDGVGLVLEALDRTVDAPRAVHLDLAISRDAAGLAIGYVSGTMPVRRTAFEVEQARAQGRGDWIEEIETHEGLVRVEIAPKLVIEALLPIVAPPNDEIMLEDVVNLVLVIAEYIPIRWATADAWQSVAPLQMLRKAGIITGTQSVDTDPEPYNELKSAIYDDRLSMYGHPVVVRELAALERNEKTGRVDHPKWTVDLNGEKVRGSKDVCDGLAGVVHCLSQRRDHWRARPQPEGGPDERWEGDAFVGFSRQRATGRQSTSRVRVRR